MRAEFLNELLVADEGPGELRLAAPIAVRVWWDDGAVWDVTVPAGARTDGASVPRLLQGGAVCVLLGLPRWDVSLRAAAVHDHLYRNRLCSRREADRIFRALLRADGVNVWGAWWMYAGVRAGGWAAR